MRIRRLHIDGFGCIRDREVEFDPDRASLLIAQNEQGKSTLAMAILALLYGLPEEGEGDGVPALRAFTPWLGGAFRAAMTIECKRGILSIERDFAAGSVAVTDGDGRDVTREFETRVGLRVGESLLGLSRHGFAKTAFVRQNDILAVKGGPEITRRLKATADSETGFVTVEEAIEVLGRFLASEGEGLDREVASRQDAVLGLAKRHEALLDVRRRAEEMGFEIDRNFAREREVLAAIRRAECLAALAAETVVTARLETEERRREELARLEAEAAALEAYHAFPADGWDELQRLVGQLETIDGEIAALQAEFEANASGPRREVERRRVPYAAMAGMTPGESDRLAASIPALRAAAGAFLAKKAELAAEEDRLAKENVSLGKHDELAARFAKLTADDGAFLAGFSARWKQNKAAQEEKKAQRDRRAAVVKEIETARKGRGTRLRVPILVVPTLLVAAGLLLRGNAALSWAFFGAGAVALVGIGIPLARNGSFRREEQDGVEAEVKRLSEELANVEGVLKAMEARLRELSQCAGISKLEQTVQLYVYWRQLEAKTAAARAMRAEKQGREKALADANAAALVFFQRAKRIVREVTPEACEKLLADLRESIKLTEEIARLATIEADLLARRGARAQARREAHAKARHLLRSGGIYDEDLVAGLARFREARERHVRCRELVEERIPAASAALTSEAAVAEWRGRQRDLRAKVASMRRADPSLEALRVERDEEAYNEEFRAANGELTRVRTERLDLLRRTGDLLAEYRREAPSVSRRLAEESRALGRARRIRRGVQVAVETLREISKEIYMTWAGELNRRSTQVLGRLTPDYEGVRFRDDLTFSIFRKDLGRDLTQSEIDALLSTGAKDQVYLAVRLALADYFSTKGEAIPVILDDAFATADDQRFQRAMEYLTGDVAGGRQVILLTCHERRHRWWLEETSAPKTRHLRVIPFP